MNSGQFREVPYVPNFCRVVAAMQLTVDCRLFWLGWLDSNQRMPESKSGALPLGDIPSSEERSQMTGDRIRRLPSVLCPQYMGWIKGLEPSTLGTTIRCSNQLSYTHRICRISHCEKHSLRILTYTVLLCNTFYREFALL